MAIGAIYSPFERGERVLLALRSQRNAQAAWDSGRFAEEVVPVHVPQRRCDALIDDP